MNFGIIGSGMIARFHAEAIQAMSNGTLKGIAGRSFDKTKSLAADFDCQAYESIEELLADPNIEIVTIATVSGAHLDPVIAAAKAGKHIICEKPLEVTPERVDEMLQVCAENAVTCAGIFNRRFYPAIEEFKQAIDAGRFGKITMAEASIKWYRDQAYYDSGAWRGTWKLDGGGALMNQSIHTIDQLLYLCGPVKAVTANMGCLIHEGIEVEDTAVATVEFESGALGVIHGSTACWSSDGHPAEVHVCGEKGSAFMADTSFRVWDFMEEQSEDARIKKELMTTSAQKGMGANDPNAIDFLGHQRNFENVVAAIQEGREPLTNGAEARRAVALICAIYESAQNGSKRIEL
ncbi:Gfo/Idh/MocA family protein [Rubritalea spongiae]|uniref:Gfo/Idh/MocA family protein n=1 Tax=Rubritalea spongiae TaxID=430797 RepID=A0ABW5E498_9BACT